MRHNSPNQERARGLISLAVVLLLAVASSTFSQTSPTPARADAATNQVAERKSSQSATCYAVQVGAYEEEAEADRMMNKLMQDYPYGMTIAPVSTRGQTRWRLRVLATSKPEALEISARLLRDQQIKAWIVPIPCS